MIEGDSKPRGALKPVLTEVYSRVQDALEGAEETLNLIANYQTFGDPKHYHARFFEFARAVSRIGLARIRGEQPPVEPCFEAHFQRQVALEALAGIAKRLYHAQNNSVVTLDGGTEASRVNASLEANIEFRRQVEKLNALDEQLAYLSDPDDSNETGEA